MTDPLESLRTPVTPVAPDPAFARRLRARVERALSPTGGPAVSSILAEAATGTEPSVRAQRPAAASDLTVHGRRATVSRLGEALVEQGGATADIVQRALKLQRSDGRKLGEILLDLGVPPSQVNAALGLQFGVTLLDLDDLEPERVAIDSLDAAFVREYRVFPYKVDDTGRLYVATTDPSNQVLARAVLEKVQRAVRLELADGEAIRRAIDRHYTVLTDVDQQADPATRGVVPFLAVADGRRAIEWYVDAMGAELRGEPYVMADGRIGHSELWIAGGPFHVADESPASHMAAPRPGADATVTLGAEVPSVDAAIERAVARGATLERPAADSPYGRNGVIRDPDGHRWLLSSPVVSDRVRNGDVAYASLWVPDLERAAGFFAAVLGWTYAPGSGEQGRRVTNTSLPQGLWGEVNEGTLFLSYFVDDIESAMARVREAGGSTDVPHREPYGYTVDCTDNAGVRFAMLEVPAGAGPSRATLARPGHGALTYITLHVTDTTRARGFYGAVFGWDFTAGNWPDGWNVLEPLPMTGMAGGRGGDGNLPVYQVDDVEVAAQRVRDAGGTASAPDRRPYGTMSDCTSPDGVAFGLWQP